MKTCHVSNLRNENLAKKEYLIYVTFMNKVNMKIFMT